MVAKRPNLAWYKDWTLAVEEVFGRKWLEKRRRVLATGANVHPIVSAWQRALAWLESSELTGRADMSTELAAFFDMGHDLHATRHLPGFARAFTPRRLKGHAWENDCYVAHVASLALRSGYTVSFIPPARDDGIKTSDLQIQRGAHVLFVECKRKDLYVRPGDAESAWPSLQENLEQLHPQIQCDYEIVVACVGRLDPAAVPAVAAAAKSVVEQGQEGEVVLPEHDTIVLVKRNPPRPPGTDGAWMPAWQNPGSAQVKVTVDAAGVPAYGPLLRTCLYLLDAHRTSQILSSLRGARSQIPRELSGIVFVAVDTSGIPEGDHELYFSVLSTWLRRELSRADNARVLAVVLTGGIARIEVTPDNAFHRSLRRWLVVRNPNATANPVIPGETQADA